MHTKADFCITKLCHIITSPRMPANQAQKLLPTAPAVEILVVVVRAGAAVVAVVICWNQQ